MKTAIAVRQQSMITTHKPILRIEGISKSFAGVRALKGVSLSVSAHSAVGIIGPNGAGKTTLFDVLTGLTPADEGIAWFEEQSLRGLSLEQLARLGVGRTFQEVSLPADLTVSEYFALAKEPGRFEGVFSNVFSPRKSQTWFAKAREEARQFLEGIGLRDRSERLCAHLSLGEQKFVSVVRAVWRHPRLLLLDEPTQNCTSDWIDVLARLLEDLRASGSAILVISHDQSFAHRISDRVLRIDAGQIGDVDRDSIVRIPSCRGRSLERVRARSRSPLLEVRRLEVSINGSRAVKGVSLDLQGGDVFGITGANGAGKSTLLKGVLGLLPRGNGTVALEGTDVTSLPPFTLVERGVSLMLQGARLAPRLTVQDAVKLCWRAGDSSDTKEAIWRELHTAEDLYRRFPSVSQRRSVRVGVLSAGEQQMLALMMSIAQRPKVLLLDEPSVGLHPLVLVEVFEWLGELADRGLGIVIVEQQVAALRMIATDMLSLEDGRLLEGARQ